MQILNRHHIEGRWPANAVYIGRGTPFGNPSSVQEAGSREQAIADYRYHLESVIGRVERGTADARDRATYDAIRGLREHHDLVCSCAPKPCHGHVIREIWESRFKDRPLVFVFGSNLAGRHGRGAADYAKQVFVAATGVGEGPTGSAYALPTKDAAMNTRPLDQIAVSAARFIAYAKEHPEITFRLTRVGCGLAGYSDRHIAPLFVDLPANVDAPPEWAPYLPMDLPAHRLLIAGSRSFDRSDLVEQVIDRAIAAVGAESMAVISGLARGADQIGKAVAERRGIPVLEYPADWADMAVPLARPKQRRDGTIYNANAGHNRNVHMGMAATGAVLFWDHQSPGTRQMGTFMRALGRPVFAVDTRQASPRLPVFRSVEGRGVAEQQISPDQSLRPG